MASAFSFLPKHFRTLSEYISPKAFDVVAWQEVLRKGPGLSKEILFKTQVNKVKTNLQDSLPEGVTYADGGSKSIAGDSDKKAAGENLLALYFYQLYHGDTVFLDLRQDRFRYEGSTLHWSPNGLWIELGNEFVVGMRELYNGFYDQDDQALRTGLDRLGLTPEHMDEPTRRQLINLLDDHFGGGRDEPVAFPIKKFVASFDKLFQFLKTNNVKLSGDFLFLGIYLVTLYLHLDYLDQEYDVAASFQRGRVVH